MGMGMEVEVGTTCQWLRFGQGTGMTEPCWCRGSTARPPQGPPLATLAHSQLQVLSGFAGKGTVCT